MLRSSLPKRTFRRWLSDLLSDSRTVDYDALEAYVADRHEELQDEIKAANAGECEEQLHIVAWKGQQEELLDLLRHFEEGDDAY